jgi:FeS assembly SUF system protein
MDEKQVLEIQKQVVDVLKYVYDPEIPVNVYDLGMIYGIDVEEGGHVKIRMTLTAPSCPAGDFLMEDFRIKVEGLAEVSTCEVELVFEPEWNQDMMSEEAKLELGFL